jgi:uncharacterized membrane protein HdeD (DUF308 family)
MSMLAAGAQRTLGRLLPPWWLYLILGIAWTVVALIVLRFDYTSVNAIAILFGIVAIAAGILEIVTTILASGWWKLLYGVLAVVFIATGIISFIHPGDTFLALAAVISFFLVFAGTFDIIELALGFWAAGYYGRSAILLVAWVAAFAIIRGVTNIVMAFRVREVQHAGP